MNEIEFLADEIFARYGAVTRARGCFLYTKKTVRLTDMFQEGGRAILGWGGSAYTMLKNTLNRGIVGSFRTEILPQLEKGASALLDGKTGGNPSRKVVVFRETADITNEVPEAKIFRPWDFEKTDYSTIDAVVIEPPLPWSINSFSLLALKSCSQIKLDLDSTKSFSALFLPPPIISGICRAIYDLIAAMKEREEKDFFIYDPVLTKYWTRKGPWLFPKVSREKYRDFLLHCLDLGIVISPIYDVPSIVPFGADRGVFTCLKNKPFDFDFAGGNGEKS